MRSLIQGALTHSCTVIVAGIAILVLGGLCLTSIPVDILPVNRTAAVQVLTFYNGMPAEAVEKNITSRLERQTGQAAGRTRQESRSIQGASIIRNYFGDDIDPAGALTQVSSLATAAVKNLPRGTDPPVILPFDPTGTTPVCVIALDSKTQSESVLYDVGRYEVRNMIMSMPGANAPSILGGKVRAVIAYVDRHKLAARGLSPLAVMEAMDDYNMFVPAGQASFGGTTYAVSSNSMHDSVEEMGEIPLRSESGNAAYLEDVATPTDSNFTQTSLVRVDGRRQVYIPVFRQPGASTLSVVDHLRKSLGEMTSRLSKGDINLQLVMDQSVYVRQAIVSLVEEGILGALMCSLVILLFLGNLRMMAIAVLIIPLSVLVAIIGLHTTGNTINVMTLAGLALAIGPLVDLAVITLENTHRHLMRGTCPSEAALHGANEVAKPAFVATCCTLIVLAPLAFLPDLGEFLFRPMAYALGFAMIAAFLLSLTLVPNCCAAWLKPESEDHHEERPRQAGFLGTFFWTARGVLTCGEKIFYTASRHYERGLEIFLAHRRRVVLGALLLLIGTLAILGPQLKREFFPEVDSGAFEMTVRAASGTRLEITEQRVAEVEQMLRETVGEDLEMVISEVGSVAGWSAAYTTNSGPMDASLKVQLTADRSRTAQEHVRRLRARVAALPEFADLEFGFDTGGMIRTAMNGGKSTPINIRVVGKDLKKLRSVADALCARVSKVEGVVDARVLQRLDFPQYIVEVDRDRAADLELPLPYVVKNVVAAINGSIQFNKNNVYIDPISKGQYFVGVQYAEEEIGSLETLLDIPITSPSQDVSIPLRNLVTIHRSTLPTEILRQDLQTGIDLVMAVDGRDLGHVAEDVVAVLKECGSRQEDGTWAPYAALTKEDSPLTAGPTMDGVRIALSGEYVRMQSMFGNLGGGLVLATLLVYLLLVTLFQSFRLPLVILFAVPLGLIGVVWMLYLTDTAINVQSLLGVIFMVGVVVANTVLLIDYTQKLRETKGLCSLDAIREASCIRMRPILMTALAALLALLPMALAFGRGSEANAPLGRAVIGGLLAGLVTTLLVVPCLYAWMIKDENPAAEPQAA